MAQVASYIYPTAGVTLRGLAHRGAQTGARWTTMLLTVCLLALRAVRAVEDRTQPPPCHLRT